MLLKFSLISCETSLFLKLDEPFHFQHSFYSTERISCQEKSRHSSEHHSIEFQIIHLQFDCFVFLLHQRLSV